MFKKKKCNRCGKKVSDKYDFCPNCGNSMGNPQNNDWGMLGKNDFMPSMNEIKLPMGFNMLFNSLMKNMNKQFSEFEKENEKSKKIKKDGISISISTFGNGPPRIKVNSLGNNQEAEVQKTVINAKQTLFSREKIKEFSSLPREEPKTNIRRLSNKVLYEIDMPGVESTENISIIKLENSIEIKAIAKEKSYFKLIPINLPLENYSLDNGKLILELGVRN